MDSQELLVGDDQIQVLPEKVWKDRESAHERIVGPFIDRYRERRARRETHPVHDFLFAYYQTNRRVLRQWRPAPFEVLQGEEARRFLEDERYVETRLGVRIDPDRMPENERNRIEWSNSLIKSAKNRPPRFNCFGLHEWAMVYKADEVRHNSTPLRLPEEEIQRVVESSAIRCTHFDAFRFFTKAAIPLNEIQPGRDDKEKNEQFGCVHFNMDLYRWAFKASPWVGSDLMRDCFLLALEARELDMRSSPYELSEYGYRAIPIETPEGRERYREEQMRIFNAGQALAERFLLESSYSLRTSVL